MTAPLPDARTASELPANLFRHAPFRRFWGTRVMSSLAFQILSVAIGWYVYALTHSAFALGLVGLAQFVPMFALTLVVGQVADRFDRRRIATICQSVEALAAGVFLLGAAQGWLAAPGVYALAAIVGTARAFESPSVSSLLPAVVPRAELPRATALSTSANQAAQILGPAFGGLLYGLGAPVAFGTSVAAFAIAGLLSGTIPLRSAPPAREPVTLRSVFSGIAFIRREPAILGALSLDLFAVLFGGATALLPIYARDILQVGPWGLGALRAAPAVGALAGTLWLTRFPLKARPGRAMFGGVIAFGIATIVFGLSRHVALSLVALAALGASDVISVVVRLSLVQLRTPDDMLGRVSAVNALFIGTSNQLGEFESGVTAAWWGAPAAIVVGGAATIAVALAWMRLFPTLRNMTSLERDR
ncbi:MFS transporter [Burkholderia multivorans]|uniref:MFS transporter n=1 Tax=Burkholderia multivorans TaxID=87883 RepID=UPI001C2313F9|nr:MFS transporter [Burkholderia multivorans]MBU9251008.1 MFS transporter [Burkholderia multivorans]MBU9255298.1 MFS transporter [Burkholderia multivorans]MDN7757458.1 MFS transporter [Burkholderia multivorans]MDR8759638.1 Enterobactin exporter EntS [Burkholderia multivorans]MDR8765536.1 Enterobactin exporter EntS [Burkholderia multivorans]